MLLKSFLYFKNYLKKLINKYYNNLITSLFNREKIYKLIIKKYY